jgi:hypothetical protein
MTNGKLSEEALNKLIDQKGREIRKVEKRTKWKSDGFILHSR